MACLFTKLGFLNTDAVFARYPRTTGPPKASASRSINRADQMFVWNTQDGVCYYRDRSDDSAAVEATAL